MISSLANMSSEEQLNEVQELRGRGLSVSTDGCTNNDTHLFSLLERDVMG